MRKTPVLLLSLLLGLTLLASSPGGAHATVELSVEAKVDLGAPVRDTVSAADGQSLYVLVEGEVLLYSLAAGKVTERIAVDKAFDRLALSNRNRAEYLVLSSTSSPTLEILALEFVQTFDLAGLPVKGREDAPVTIAVFSDYQ